MNTHYNVIDTLFFAFGEETMYKIGKALTFHVNISKQTPVIQIREYILEELRVAVPELEASNHAVRYTLLDCFLFAATEGLVGNYVYGFGHFNVKAEELKNLVCLFK